MSDLPPAIWPKQREIFAHLRWRPWIRLPISFDSKKCLSEGMALAGHFVTHRPGDQKGEGGRWKSLALRAVGGDPRKTLNPDEYGATEADYQFTPALEQCPTIRDFLRNITDLDQCGRVRLMLLEPGAEILVHSDAPAKEHSLAVNVAFNMPAGCEFWVDLEPDGSQNPFSHAIPWAAGEAMLFNSATYHRVFNESAFPRLHLIFHGPLRLAEEAILAQAREQNGWSSYREVVNALVQKQALLGKEMTENSELFLDWASVGASPAICPPFLALGLTEAGGEDKPLAEEAGRITEASLYPLRGESFPLAGLDDWLQAKRRAGFRFALVLGEGTFLNSSLWFLFHTLRLLGKMARENIALAGHLLDRPERLPCLHEQFLLLQLENFPAGHWFTEGPLGDEILFPPCSRSPENVHDDYTPLWLAPGGELRRGKRGWGTRALGAILSAGGRVENLPSELRRCKDYLYPDLGRGPNYQRVRAQVEERVQRAQRELFVFNTEPLAVRDFSFRPTLLMSPCAGFKPLALYRQFVSTQAHVRFLFLEKNEDALAHYRDLLACASYSEVLRVVERALARQSAAPVDARYVKSRMAAVLAEGFSGDPAEFLRCLRAVARVAEVKKLDYLADQDALVDLFPPGERALFWHSNAWDMQVSLFLSSAEELKQNYRDLVAKLVLRLGASAWIHAGGRQEAVLGESVSGPQWVLTSGGTKFGPPTARTYEAFILPSLPEASRVAP